MMCMKARLHLGRHAVLDVRSSGGGHCTRVQQPAHLPLLTVRVPPPHFFLPLPLIN